MSIDHRMGWPGLAALIADAMPQPRRSMPLGTPRTEIDQAARAALDIDPADEPELPEGVWESARGVFSARCRNCERDYELLYDWREFTEDGNYCGGSERCIP